MKTWCRASVGVGGGEQKPGTSTLFLDYDLRCWLFGVSVEPDTDWFEVKLSFGPIGVGLTHWRRHVYQIGA